MKNGILRNAFNGMVRARQRQAHRYAQGFLLTLDDETLNRFGVERDRITR